VRKQLDIVAQINNRASWWTAITALVVVAARGESLGDLGGPGWALAGASSGGPSADPLESKGDLATLYRQCRGEGRSR
jgi:hypothetical protein